MINGDNLRGALVSAANNISLHRKEVDALNVFPVPDGDTGTNMSLTLNTAKRELLLIEDGQGANAVAKAAASALLRGARGNSGVILSLLMRGFADGVKDRDTIKAKHIARALRYGVDAAYKAVMKPTEGTMLTVARQCAEKAEDIINKESDISVLSLWKKILEAGRASLENTPNLLPVLKKAGVVDAGGKGLLLIYEGMYYTFETGLILPEPDGSRTSETEIPDERNAAGEYEGEITFTYCTEFIAVKDESVKKDALSLRAYLESIGDSVVVVEDEEIIKCHVHTDNPGDAMQKALKYGMLSAIKIDNMRLQHADQKKKQRAVKNANKFSYVPVDNGIAYGFVAVAAGDGIGSLFKELGVNNVVSGGQTMNPSTDDILEAVHATPAKNVIVLPNNKNIIMAAEQAIKLADRNVYVLPTTTIPQGLASLLAFDSSLELGENQLNMVKTIEKVGSGMVTYAARDSVFESQKIKKGEILALENNKLAFVEKDINKAVLRLIKSLLKKDSTFVTLIYGEDVSPDEAQQLEKLVASKLPASVEFVIIQGGQPVYYYIISVE